MQTTQMELPKLMEDDSEKDGRPELVMDYIISWTLRRADFKCSIEKPILYGYCREILAKLLGITLDDNTLYEQVRVWKQDQDIDLWIELQINRNGAIEQHAILIEDKFYSKLRPNQLENYKERFEAHYVAQPDEWYRHYVLITCIDRRDSKFEEYYGKATSLGFMTYYIEEIFGKNHKECESDIFNEFWLRW